MHAETMSQLRDYNHVILLTDVSNQSELLLMARIVKDQVVKNLFLDLLQLRRCDAVTIFNTVEKFLENESINIKNTSFSGMNACSRMPCDHSVVKWFF